MPVSYRSKSVRRFNETNCRITSLIEKDNTKILASASVQLFISTPQLEKWFKSSTGAVCFLKDFTQKSTYYFRLYSLMQGQLWEQEMHSPFIYKKLSPVFHYLSVNRFNFGFKFICEDEAERFYSAISKFGSVKRHDINENSPIFHKKLAQSLLLNSTENSNEHSITSVSNQVHESSSKKNRRNFPTTPLGQIATAAAAIAHSATSFVTSQHHQSASSSTHSLTGSSIDESKGKAPTPTFQNFLCSRSDTVNSNSNHRSRRMFYSTERKKIIKSDISCPFRCSRKDLNTSICDQNASQSSLKVPNSINLPPSSLTKLSPGQRARSAASFSKVSLKSLDQKDVDEKKLNVSLISATSSTTSMTSSSCLNSRRQLVNNLQSSANSSSTLKSKIQSDNNLRMSRQRLSVDKVNPELEATKQILMEYNVPINKKIIKDLMNYIVQSGGIDKFQNTLKLESERHKLNLFIAQTSAASIAKIKSDSLTKTKQPVLNNYVDPFKTSSPNRSKFQALMPPLNTNNNSIVSLSPLTPHKSKQSQIAAIPPCTPPVTPSSNSIKSQSQKTYTYNQSQTLTPVSLQKQAISGQRLITSQFDKTPIKTPGHLTNSISRTQTPSPSRNNQLRQNLVNLPITPSSIDVNAPPKPPRRTSLKLVN